MTARIGRTSALLGLLVAAMTVFAAVTLAVVHVWSAHVALEDARLRLELVTRIARDDRGGPTGTLQGLLIPGSTTGRSAAALQERLGAAARAAGVQLRSIQVLDPKSAESLTEIAMELSCQATTTSLRALLHDIETGVPLLVVASFAARAVATPQASAEEPVQLEVTMKVTGFTLAREQP
ncbi:MAG: type II secretion system protein GspM [Hyphomicrobiaceae bacterium]|nr:type II secretion system protein GspM [Hyphomicrobiaceae bacterium]